MSDLREADFLFHVDMEPSKVSPGCTMEDSLAVAWDMLRQAHPDMRGCKVVLAVVKDNNG
jgi:hypothetical protein